MKNWEKYENEIKRLGIFNVAVLEDTGEIVPCKLSEGVYRFCNGCKFKNTDCGKALTKWLYKEAEEEKKPEPPRLTQEEYIFITNLYSGYIARDFDGYLFVYDEKPEKKWDTWEASPVDCYFAVNKELFKDVVKWEDEEPWKIADMKKLKVKPATRAENKVAESEEA